MWEFFCFFVKHGEIQSLEPFYLVASYINIDVAIAAFSDSTFPAIGILISLSALFATSSLNPFASFPINKAQSFVSVPELYN